MGRLIVCGVLSLELLGFCGFSQDRLQISFLASGIGWGSTHWNLVHLCLMWCIWKERNRQTFEDLDRPNDQLLASFTGSLFDWSRAWRLISRESLPLFLSSLFLCNLFLLSVFASLFCNL